MIPTANILAALSSYITGLNLFDRVTATAADALPAALDALRDPSARLCFLVAGEDTIEHQLVDGYNTPLRAEITSRVQILVSAHDAAYSPEGTADVLPLKDQLLSLLMWESLSLPGLIALPRSCAPLRIEWEDAPAVSAWQLEVDFRQRVTP